MENRLIFRYLQVLRWGDGEGYISRVLEVPVQAGRQASQENPESSCRDVMTCC